MKFELVEILSYNWSGDGYVRKSFFSWLKESKNANNTRDRLSINGDPPVLLVVNVREVNYFDNQSLLANPILWAYKFGSEILRNFFLDNHMKRLEMS